jgi:hypothetical protein
MRISPPVESMVPIRNIVRIDRKTYLLIDVALQVQRIAVITAAAEVMPSVAA